MGQKLQEGKRVSTNAKTVTPPESKGSTRASALFVMKCGDIVRLAMGMRDFTKCRPIGAIVRGCYPIGPYRASCRLLS